MWLQSLFLCHGRARTHLEHWQRGFRANPHTVETLVASFIGRHTVLQHGMHGGNATRA